MYHNRAGTFQHSQPEKNPVEVIVKCQKKTGQKSIESNEFEWKKTEIQQDEYLNPYDISIGDYKRGFLFNERENITVYCYRWRAHINFAHEFNNRTIDDAYGFFQCKMDEWFEIGERFINYTMEKKYANELQSVGIEFCSKRKDVVIRPHI